MIIGSLKNVLKSFNAVRIKMRDSLAEKLAVFFVISFPKSGRTWFRVFLAKYFNLAFGAPVSLNFSRIFRPNEKLPRIIFSHGDVLSPALNAVEKDVARLKNKKVIFVARDPRDTAVSYYFQQEKRSLRFGGAAATAFSMSDFIRDKVFGIERIIDFMNLWYGKKDSFGGFILIRYEDLKRNPSVEFSRTLKFLDLKVMPDFLKEAVEYSSFDNMKKLERGDILKDDRLRPSNPEDPESFKVRKGTVGGYADYLNAEDIAYANKEMKRLNPGFGYRL